MATLTAHGGAVMAVTPVAGTPVVVTVKDGKHRLPRRFKCRVHGAVPEDSTATVLVDVCWDGYSRGRKVPPENIAEGPGSTERIVFRMPPDIFHSDIHIIKALDRLRRAFNPCDLRLPRLGRYTWAMPTASPTLNERSEGRSFPYSEKCQTHHTVSETQ